MVSEPARAVLVSPVELDPGKAGLTSVLRPSRLP